MKRLVKRLVLVVVSAALVGAAALTGALMARSRVARAEHVDADPRVVHLHLDP